MAPVDNRYLLRVWRESERVGGLQVTLRDVSDGRVRSFDELDEMLDYLKSSLAEADPADGHRSVPARESHDTDA